MDRTNKLLCPKCGASMKSAKGVRIGRTIKCPKCQAPFTVRPEDAEQAASVNAARLLLILSVALLYMSGGALLAYYCFALNSPKHGAARLEAGEQNGSADGGDDPSTTPRPAQRTTVPVSAEQQRKIDNAIANGVWFLKDHQLPDGTWPSDFPVGYTALGGLTLLECGVPSEDAVVRKAAEYVRQHAVLTAKSRTYEWALAILFLDRLGQKSDEKLIQHVASYPAAGGNLTKDQKSDEKLIQHLALCLIAGQSPETNFWGYASPVLDAALVPQLLKGLKNEKQSLANWRKAALKGATFDSGACDNSNTQFAVLALWVAGRHDVAIRRTVALLEKHFRTTQLPSGPDPSGNNLNLDGAWPYNPAAGTTSNVWPTMTCSGLLGLAIAHGVKVGEGQTKQQSVDDPAIQRGLAMLGREIDRPGEKRPTDLYFLWSMERVGVLYNQAEIGGKDWYAWGCKSLLPNQDADGSWKAGAFWGNTPVLNTCFALLFLKQANLAQDLTNKLHLLEKK